MARVRPGEAANPAPPTVQRVRIRFAKRGRLRFLSHRDVARSVERVMPSGRRQIDVRAAVASASVGAGEDSVASHTAGAGVCAILTAVVRQTTPAVRPDDVLGALDVVAGLRPPVPAKATRMAQGLLDDRGGLADPLGPPRVTTQV